MKNRQSYSIAKTFSVITLMFLLILLTCLNLLIYNQEKTSSDTYKITLATEENPTTEDTDTNQPDEKAPERPVTISEEFLHDLKEASALKADKLIHCFLQLDKKIAAVHFETATPPPDPAV